jgi:catechol 2,3-dioxygenase-like lactoylglutathione lyase family enzyme
MTARDWLVRINHININCYDIDAMLAFYRGVLGCTSVASGGTPDSGAVFSEMGYPGQPGARTEVLALPGQLRGPYIELIQWVEVGADRRSEPRDIGMARIGFVVNDVEKAHQEMVKAGAQVLGPPHGGGVGESKVRAFFFLDPEKNLLEMLQFAGLST